MHIWTVEYITFSEQVDLQATSKVRLFRKDGNFQASAKSKAFVSLFGNKTFSNSCLSQFSAGNDSTISHSPKQYQQAGSLNNNHLPNPSSDNNSLNSSLKKSSPINIHIEVDIDPPKDQQKLSPEELQRLGLPPNHVHYDNINKPHVEELLAPSDIKVTYSETELEEKPEVQDLKDRIIETEAYENYQNYNEAIFGNSEAAASPEPPRALPSQEEGLVPPPQHHNGDISDRVPPSEVTYEDKLFSLEAMCDLNCGPGSCLLERLEEDSLRKRCLCPMGKTGEKCAFGKKEHSMIFSPKVE